MTEVPMQAVVLPVEKPQGCLKIGAVTTARLFVHFLALGMIFFVLCGPVQTFIHYFEQENLKLPAMTILMVNASYRMNHHFFVIIPGLLLIDFVALLALQLPPRPWRILARLWFSAVLFGAFLFLALGMFAMAIPIDAALPEPSRAFPHEQPTPAAIEAETKE